MFGGIDISHGTPAAHPVTRRASVQAHKPLVAETVVQCCVDQARIVPVKAVEGKAVVDEQMLVGEVEHRLVRVSHAVTAAFDLQVVDVLRIDLRAGIARDVGVGNLHTVDFRRQRRADRHRVEGSPALSCTCSEGAAPEATVTCSCEVATVGADRPQLHRGLCHRAAEDDLAGGIQPVAR